jgi:hypothetical protein
MVKTVTQYGKALCLLYKDARYDMAALDEMFGPTNWQKTYRAIGDSLFCTVSVWNGTQWISKEDVGTESQVDREKGQASDAFKRACYNWGIGRELYTAPDIWIPLDRNEVGSYEAKGKQVYTCRQSFYVDDIGYTENGVINKLVINDASGRKRFAFNEGAVTTGKTSPIEPSVDEYRVIAEAKVKATKKFNEAWKAKVLAGLPTYDLSTVRRLVTETLKGE